MTGLNKRSLDLSSIFATNKTINGGRTPLITTGMGRKGQSQKSRRPQVIVGNQLQSSSKSRKPGGYK